MSEICLIEELDQSIGNVALLRTDASHVCDENGLEVLANRAEVSVAHHCLH